MNFSPHSFVSVNEILADVLKITNDADFRVNTRGWYISQIRQALQELSFDTFFDERNEELIIPHDLRVEMPKGAFNLKQMFLFNGTKCNVGQNTPNVYYKQNYWTGGTGYLAKDKWDNNGDPFHKNRSGSPQARNEMSLGSKRSNLYFFGMQNGLIMLSESCKQYEKIMIFYNGIGGEAGDLPVIPTHLRQAVKDYVSLNAIDVLIADSYEPAQMNKWTYLRSTVDNRLNKPYDGSWAKAEYRVKHTDKKIRQDYKEYLAKMNY